MARQRSCGVAEARARLAQARAYLETARLAGAEEGTSTGFDFNHVAAGNAVLAAIASSDTLCCLYLGVMARGQDHHEAVELLHTIRVGEGSVEAQRRRAMELGTALANALDLKDHSHYGPELMGGAQVRRAVRAAEKLVSAAEQAMPKERRNP